MLSRRDSLRGGRWLFKLISESLQLPSLALIIGSVSCLLTVYLVFFAQSRAPPALLSVICNGGETRSALRSWEWICTSALLWIYGRLIGRPYIALCNLQWWWWNKISTELSVDQPMSEECHVSCAGNRLQVQLLLCPRSQTAHSILSICSNAAHRLHHVSGILILQSPKLHTLSICMQHTV